MKWIQFTLISLLLFGAMIFMKPTLFGSLESNNATSEWLVRFKTEINFSAINWPTGVHTTSTHAPLHAVSVSTSLSDAAFLQSIKHVSGIARVEKGYRDVVNSSVYPTGLALIEPSGDALSFLAKTFAITPVQQLDALGWYVVEIPEAFSFEAFRRMCIQSGCIKQVHRDEIISCTSHQTNDPLYSTAWHIQQANDIDIDAPQAWSLLPSNTPVRSIAMIEGVGVDTLNADLAGRFIDKFNAVDNTSNIYANTTSERHGTATNGIPCAITNNAISAAGLGYNKLKLQSIKIGYNITSTGNFTTTSVLQAAAINRAMAQSSTVAISMSFGSTSFQSAFLNAITTARVQGRANKGIPVFASTGNSGLSAWTNYPASYTGVIAVGATTSADGRASFSNYGPGITLSAPGSTITTTDITGAEGYGAGDNTYFTGTSASCPVAATVGALMIVVNNQLTETQVKQLLAQSCEKVGGFTYASNATNTYSTWCNELGYGRVNMKSALDLCLALNNPTPDITLSGVSVSSTAPSVGQSITINASQQIAPATSATVTPTLEYRYSNDALWSADDIVVGSDISTLGNGISSESENITFTIPSGSGTKYILLRADALSAVNESSETNNTFVLTLNLAATANLPDITITNAAVSAASVIAGQTITISCNQSCTSAGTTLFPALQYRLSTDVIWQSTDIYIGTDISSLSNTILSEAENITYVIPATPGIRYILIKADAGSSVSESNENNNVVSIPITIAAAMNEWDTNESIAPEERMPVLFPNPANDKLRIDIGNQPWKSMCLLDANGICVMRCTISEYANTSLDVSHYPAGFYSVLLSNDASFCRVPLIIQ